MVRLRGVGVFSVRGGLWVSIHFFSSSFWSLVLG